MSVIPPTHTVDGPTPTSPNQLRLAARHRDNNLMYALCMHALERRLINMFFMRICANSQVLQDGRLLAAALQIAEEEICSGFVKLILPLMTNVTPEAMELISKKQLIPVVCLCK